MMFALGTGPAALPVQQRRVAGLPSLGPLSLSNATAAESIGQGGAIGTVLGTTAGSTLALVDSAAGRFVLAAGTIQRGPTALDFETAISHRITLRETLAGAANRPCDTVLTIAVANAFEQPALAALTLSTTTLTVGQSTTILIAGATHGSVLVGSVPPGMTLNSAARTIAGTPTMANSAFEWELVETLSDSVNSPRSSNGTLEIAGVVGSVAASGWQAVMTTPGDLAFAPVSLSRQGFTAAGAATTIVETLLTTKRVRESYPNQANLTASSVALSDYVYSTDTIAGVTNNSAETSPKPIANWIMPHRTVVANTLEAELVAFHRNASGGRQVACVEFIASDGVNPAVSVKVSAPAVSGRIGDRNAVISYKAVLDIAGLNPGLVTLNARVYPRIGGAASVADSAADGNAARGFSPRYFLKNTGAKTLAYVKTAANGGNDSTGVVSTNAATATASPFLTALAAQNALNTALAATSGFDMGELRIGDDGGTPFVLASHTTDRTQKVAAFTITRDPAVPKANARVSFGATGFRFRGGNALAAPITTGAVLFRDIALVRTGTSTISGLDATHQVEIIFDDCSFDNGGFNTTWLSNSHDWHYGTSFTNMANGTPLNVATAGEHRILRGVNWQAVATPSGYNVETWCVVGCALNCPNLTRGTRTFDGAIVAFNTLTRIPEASQMLAVGQDENIVGGFALVQNVIEYIGTTSSTASLRVNSDSASGNTSHFILHNNTFAGAYQAGRHNLFYDEGATRRTNKLMSVVGNIFTTVYTKSDLFRGQVEAGADASSATGNWAFSHGVGCRGNFTQFQSNTPVGGNEAQDYPGLGANYGTSQSVRNDPLFTAYAGTTVAAGPIYSAGAGGGTYTLTGASPAKAMVADPVVNFGLGGAPRAVANDAAGAYAV